MEKKAQNGSRSGDATTEDCSKSSKSPIQAIIDSLSEPIIGTQTVQIDLTTNRCEEIVFHLSPTPLPSDWELILEVDRIIGQMVSSGLIQQKDMVLMALLLYHRLSTSET